MSQEISRRLDVSTFEHTALKPSWNLAGVEPGDRKDLAAGRAATERFSAQLPRAHWSGPEQRGRARGECIAPIVPM